MEKIADKNDTITDRLDRLSKAINATADVIIETFHRASEIQTSRGSESIVTESHVEIEKHKGEVISYAIIEREKKVIFELSRAKVICKKKSSALITMIEDPPYIDFIELAATASHLNDLVKNQNQIIQFLHFVKP